MRAVRAVRELAGRGEDARLDGAARALLERFWNDGDAEAFTRLFELTHSRLLRAATSIVRRLAPQLEPEDLVSNFMARLFTDLRPHELRSLVAFARTAMRNDALDHVRRQRRAAANARQWQLQREPPADPSRELLAAEAEQILSRLDSELLRVCHESFAALETRDQQVLVAREIVGLSYGRVAGVMRIAPDQVGMLIRRARVHLLERMRRRMPERTGEPGAEVRERLAADGAPRHVPALLRRMLERSAEAGRRVLADLVYEMAKACLVHAPGFAERTLVRSEPRSSEAVGSDLRRIAARLGETDDALAGTRPGPATAIADARSCLERLRDLEGCSGRQQVALALCHVHADEPERAEALLRALLDRPLPAITRQNAARNLTLALLRQERFAEALASAESGAEEWPRDPVRVMNVAYAAARLRDAARFAGAAAELAALHEAEPTPRVAAWLREELPRLAAETGLETPTALAPHPPAHPAVPAAKKGASR